MCYNDNRIIYCPKTHASMAITPPSMIFVDGLDCGNLHKHAPKKYVLLVLQSTYYHGFRREREAMKWTQQDIVFLE